MTDCTIHDCNAAAERDEAVAASVRAHGQLRKAHVALTEIGRLCSEALADSGRRGAVPVADLLAILREAQ